LLKNRVIHLARSLVQTPPPPQLHTYPTTLGFKTPNPGGSAKKKTWGKNFQTDEPVLKIIFCSHNPDPATKLRQESNTRPHSGSNPSRLRLHTPHSQRSERAYTRQHTPPVNQNRLSVFCPNPARAALLLLFLSFSLPRRHLHHLHRLRGAPIQLRVCLLQASSSKDFTTRSQIPPSPSFVSD
jgi:hypothetical protein